MSGVTDAEEAATGGGVTVTGAGGGAGSEFIPPSRGVFEIGREFVVEKSGAARLLLFAPLPEGVFGAAIFDEIMLGLRVGAGAGSSTVVGGAAVRVLMGTVELFPELAFVFFPDAFCVGGALCVFAAVPGLICGTTSADGVAGGLAAGWLEFVSVATEGIVACVAPARRKYHQ